MRLVVKIPGDTNNNTIPREILRQLLGKVAPEIHRQLGHSVAYIDQTVITPVPLDASGRNSDESKSASSGNSLLIAVGVVLGVVFLFAMIVIVWYRRKREGTVQSTGEGCVITHRRVQGLEGRVLISYRWYGYEKRGSD